MAYIYLDNAATTPVRPEVEAAMEPYFGKYYENPSGIYTSATGRRKEVEKARALIGRTLHADASEIYFTSGGTESDNWALKGAAALFKERGRHIITTAIEHHAVLNSCRELEKEGFAVTYLGVDERGRVRMEELVAAIRPDTILISVMYANNEVGTIQPVEEIGRLAGERGILFHTDAVQVYGQLPIDVGENRIGMLSASAHKLNGPKGVGFLYVNRKIPLPSLLHGGGQEGGRRAGTENVPGIIGLGKAAELACSAESAGDRLETQDARERRIFMMREHLVKRLLSEIPYCRLNGDRKHRMPGNCSVSFQFVEGASLLLMLDEAGICASAGSACSAGSPHPSHVLRALGLPENIAHGTLRLTIGYQNTMEEIDYAADHIREFVGRLREKSGEYQRFREESQSLPG